MLGQGGWAGGTQTGTVLVCPGKEFGFDPDRSGTLEGFLVGVWGTWVCMFER